MKLRGAAIPCGALNKNVVFIRYSQGKNCQFSSELLFVFLSSKVSIQH